MDRHIFISHASEDKDTLVRPLVVALAAAGVRIWYDENDIKVGDSLRASIDQGLRNASFGILVLSEPFFRKQWTSMELDGLIAQQSGGHRANLLPIWHGVSVDFIRQNSPMLAGLKALDSSIGVEAMTDAITERLRLNEPYRQIAGEHRVHLHDLSGARATVTLSRTVQVGGKPLDELWARVPASKRYRIRSVAPGRLDRLEPDTEQVRAVVRHDPPLSPGLVFTQRWILEARKEYSDRMNSAGLRSALAYERFTLAVQTDHPETITDVEAHQNTGMLTTTLHGLRADPGAGLYELTIDRPDPSSEYALTWRRA